MSELLLDEKNGKIKDVYFAYVKIKKPVKKYQSEETEYSVDVVVDKATAKEMKKKFPKNGVREVENEEFEEAFKFEPPFPDQEEQFVLKFKTPSTYKDGSEKPYEYSSRPKIYVPQEDKVKDVTLDVRVGNGSKGDLAFNVVESSYGVFHRLNAILVRDLIELPETNHNPFGEVVEEEETEDVPF